VNSQQPTVNNTPGIQKLLIAALFLLSQVGIAAGLFWEKNNFVEE
jgi:uncharacterized membrane protein